ncbi:protein pygopus-like isoform X2 [Leptopilina boulardi]|uniref:protein pygopus-like isoform X2 n=1 Tax=Leptopilina boulardi TaxID=63433 RepID=UPI0021F5ACCA|nr:protein pygopus-like isoform X2 [Leptopilina boulardi]
MAFQAVNNPDIPYVGEVEDGVFPGKMVKIQGKAPSDAVRFAVNYQLGPNLNPRDDIAIHVSPRFNDGFMTRNHIQSMNWGQEENDGPLLIQPGQEFEIILLCKYDCFKIAVNGRHFTDFIHRIPFNKITHLTVDGDVEISSIFYETLPDPQRSQRPTHPVSHDLPPVDFGPPKPGNLYPSLDPQGPNGAPHGPPHGFPPGGYNQPSQYGPGGNDYNYQPGYQRQEQEEEDSGLDKMGLALGGLIAAGGTAAAIYAYNKKKQREREQGDGDDHEKEDASKSQTEGGLNLGSLGAALASSLAANALQGGGGTRPQSAGYPPQESGGLLGSLLGSLGGGGHQQPSSDPLGGLGSLLSGGNRQPSSDPLGGLGSLLGGNQSGHSGSDSMGGLGSLLGNFMGGGGHQQPAYQPSGGYGGNYPQSQGSQGSDLLSNLGSSLLSSAFDGLSKRKDVDAFIKEVRYLLDEEVFGNVICDFIFLLLLNIKLNWLLIGF